MKIEKNLKIVMKTSIGMKISMTMINPMIRTVLIVEIVLCKAVLTIGIFDT